MSKTKEKQNEKVLELLTELDKLLTDRISDLHDVKGGMQSRHTFILYRQYVWSIKKELQTL